MSNCDNTQGTRKQAIVLETKRDLALVKVDDYSNCGSCPLTGCASNKETDKPVWAVNPLGAKKDDRVLISQSARGYLISAILMFIFPVLILILAVVAFGRFLPDNLALFLAIGSALLYYVIAAIFRLFERATTKWAFRIDMVLPQDSQKDPTSIF